MSKLNNCYCLETEHSFYNNNSDTPSETACYDSKSQTRFSRLEIFPESKMFCNKPAPLFTTQYHDLFITYKEGFNMHTDKRYLLQLPEDEQYDKLSTKNSTVNNSRNVC